MSASNQWKQIFSYKACEDGIQITGYKGNAAEVDIPAEIDGHAVVEIGHRAFLDKTFIKKVAIPNSVERVSETAFSGCTGLADKDGLVVVGKFLCESTKKRKETIIVPTGVEEILPDAFKKCSWLQKVVLPNGLKKIWHNAFPKCSSLYTVNIPESVDFIGDDAFQCEYLREITVSPATLARMDGKQVRRQFVTKVLALNWLQDPKSTDAPLEPHIIAYLNTKQAREEAASRFLFREHNLEAFAKLLGVLKKTDFTWVESLLAEAQKKSLADAVSFLLEYQNTHFPADTKTKIEEDKADVALGVRERTTAEWREIFKFSSQNGEIVISEYRGTDPYVVIPAEIGGKPVTAIKEGAFLNNKVIQEVVIPDCVVSIGGLAFRGCDGLADENGMVIVKGRLESLTRKYASVTVPDGVASIGVGAFAGNDQLRQITLPESLTSIGALAFRDCYELTAITIPKGVVRIGEDAFAHCSGLTKITIPDSVTVIEKGTFASCMSLTEMTIPEGVTTIKAYAFSDCASLKRIKLPASVTKIGAVEHVCGSITFDEVFGRCSNLTIHAPAGSYAETYAKENNIPFVAE